tara:strand:+ start:37 stop:639 length:603 start_codon:yes stop_codon:yes gene_type:complete
MGNLTTARSVTFFDVETTHLDPTRSTILSISILTDWEDGSTEVWSTKIKPKNVEMNFASKEALQICKYDQKEWENAPTFEEVAPTIADKLKWGPLVGHNIQFDIAHLTAVFNRYGWKKSDRGTRENEKCYRFGYPCIDTCALAYIFLPTERQNLNALREHFDIDVSRAHDSETDVEDCRHVFYSIISHVAPEEKDATAKG